MQILLNSFLTFLVFSTFVHSQQLELVYNRAAFSNQVLGQPSVGWPMFQNNAQHTGHNEFSNISLPLYLRWERTDLNKPLNAVSVAGDRVLVTYAKRWFAALDTKDGTDLYVWHLGDIYDIGQPSYSEGRVYVQANYATLSFIAAFDAVSGDSLWTAPYRAQWVKQYAPIIHKNTLLFSAAVYGGVQANNATTGEFLWWKRSAYWEGWTPAAHGDVVFTWLGGRLKLLDLYTGDTLWSVLATASTKREEPPLYWMGTAAVIDTINSIAYCMLHKDFYAVDLNKRQVIWSDTGDFGGGINPSIADNKVFAIRNGDLKAYDGITGVSLWLFSDESDFIYPPAIANGYIFVSSKDKVHAVNIQTHTSDWSDSVGGFLTIAENSLYVSDSSGKLYAFGDITTAIEDDQPPELPATYVLRQNYPNPFNPTTEITYEIPSRSLVSITVYNTLGQRVKTLIKAEQSAGLHSVIWDGTDQFRKIVSSGTYFYKLTAGEFVDSKKMMLLK